MDWESINEEAWMHALIVTLGVAAGSASNGDIPLRLGLGAGYGVSTRQNVLGLSGALDGDLGFTLNDPTDDVVVALGINGSLIHGFGTSHDMVAAGTLARSTTSLIAGPMLSIHSSRVYWRLSPQLGWSWLATKIACDGLPSCGDGVFVDGLFTVGASMGLYFRPSERLLLGPSVSVLGAFSHEDEFNGVAVFFGASYAVGG